MQQILGGKMLRIEQEQQHRHEYRPAADAEHAGKDTDERSKQEIG